MTSRPIKKACKHQAVDIDSDVMDSPLPKPLAPNGRHQRRAALTDQVRDLIADEFILNGAVSAGALLPSEKELSERYVVSRPTVRLSLHSLQEAGMLTVRSGVGAMVMPLMGTMSHRFDRLVSLETFGREAGKTVTSAHTEWTDGQASDIATERLELAAGHRVLTVQRLKVVDGKPVGWFIDTMPEGIIPFDIFKREFTGSALDVLLTHYELDIAYEDVDIEPVNLTGDLAKRLSVKDGTAALFADAVTRNVNGKALEWAQFWLLRETMRFCVRRRPQIGRRRL